ncbi:MAG: hypothetical protein IT166_12760 [Bryobacterales bacterium]|nr:hypothetical protein [Bryobacterales bacterium]
MAVSRRLHPGARGSSTGAFVMSGKAFKNLTGEMPAWRTRELPALEIAFNEVRPGRAVPSAWPSASPASNATALMNHPLKPP